MTTNQPTHRQLKRALSKRKCDWLKAVQKFEIKYRQLRDEVISTKTGHNKSAPVTTGLILKHGYIIRDHNNQGLGPRGQRILDEAIRFGMKPPVIMDIYVHLKALDRWSSSLKKEAETIWDHGEFEDWPLFSMPQLNIGESLEDAAAAKDIMEMMDDENF